MIRFGKIISTKAIIDTQNGECRGYGFVDFEQPQDAEQAIKEMSIEGAQVQMAKQQEQDPTNLYIANLPMSITDTDLKSLCQPYGEVSSTPSLSLPLPPSPSSPPLPPSLHPPSLPLPYIIVTLPFRLFLPVYYWTKCEIVVVSVSSEWRQRKCARISLNH